MDKSTLCYTSLFCEENIWKLVEYLQGNNSIIAQDVLFIINPNRHIAIFEQAISNSNLPVIWDYHVILSAYTENGPVIYDFDSRLSFPVDLQTYFSSSFKHWYTLPEEYRPYLRVIEALKYFKNFYSDRSHMKGCIDIDEFPDYPIITPEDKCGILSLDRCRFVVDEQDFESLIRPNDYAERFVE